MHDIEPKLISGYKDGEEFVSDALEVVELKFVGSVEEIGASPSYLPEFVYQHFGESEKIVGYKDLKIKVLYSDLTLFLTSTIEYLEKADDNLKRDDIDYKVKDALPITQLDAYLPMEKFKQKISEQSKFKPFGDLTTKFDIGDSSGLKRNFELYKFGQESVDQFEEGTKYLERAQALAHWYIEGVTYTDNEDPRYFNYFLFEVRQSEENGCVTRKFAGFANLYRFYHHPDKDRVRIAQMLVAPPYRKMGLGTRFLQAIYDNLCRIESFYDITAESPADNFLYMRDYVDCVNCSKLPEFSPNNLKGSYTAAMREAARDKYKLNKAQSRRIYEILRLHHTNMNIPEEKKAYKLEVMKRLKKLVMDPKKDGSRLSRVLQNDEQARAVAMHALEPEQQEQQLSAHYQNTMDSYKVVLNRLVRFEKDFVR